MIQKDGVFVNLHLSLWVSGFCFLFSFLSLSVKWLFDTACHLLFFLSHENNILAALSVT